MKLSEAISLGHTLIREDRSVYHAPAGYSGPTPCGCAIGSAYAATGGAGRLFYGVEWLEEHWPWTAQPPKGSLLLYKTRQYKGERVTAARAISRIHYTFKVPRLEIAKMVAEIEPQGPEGDYVPDGRESAATAHAIVNEAETVTSIKALMRGAR